MFELFDASTVEHWIHELICGLSVPIKSLNVHIYIYIVYYFICTHVHTPRVFTTKTQIKILQTRSQNSSTPKLGLHWYYSNPSVSSPVLLLGLHQIPGVFRPGDDLIDEKNVKAITFAKKKKKNKNDRNTSFQLNNQKSLHWQIFFKKSFPHQHHHISTINPNHQNLNHHPVWCRATYFATLRGWPSWSLRPNHGCLAVFEKKTGDEWRTYEQTTWKNRCAIVLNQVLTNWDKEKVSHQSHPEVPADFHEMTIFFHSRAIS